MASIKRFKVTGTRPDNRGDFDIEDSVYVDAADSDDAVRRARWWFTATTRAVPVRWDEGRGVLWRLWRRLVRR